MWYLVTISGILSLFVVIPKALHALGSRAICPNCRYDLSGLDNTGVCPECGFVYDKATINVRIGWEFRWQVIPRLVVAMLVPALGPSLFLHAYAWILWTVYDWPWWAAWYQAAERELVGVGALLSIPFLINSWAVVALPDPDGKGQWKLSDRIERPDFWPRLAATALLGAVLLASCAFIPYLHRRYFDALWMLLPAVAILGFALLGVHIAFDARLNRAKRAARHHDQPSLPPAPSLDAVAAEAPED